MGNQVPAVGQCRCGPPGVVVLHQVVAIPTPKGIEQQVREIIDGAWPSVRSDMCCGAYAPGVDQTVDVDPVPVEEATRPQ